MNSFKPLFVVLAGLFIIILMIPTLLVTPYMQKSTTGELSEELQAKKETEKVLSQSAVTVPVYRSTNQQIENIPLEEYVIGVVSSEMPAEFEEEALKAQALAARTYIVKQLMSEETMSSPEGSVVTDTQMHQVYKNPEELKKTWKDDYEWKMKKITAAVADTQGEILTFDEKPIDASFFSTSNGYTENSEDYWSTPLPYLKTVESPWDKKSEKFLDQKVVSVSEFEKKLGVNIEGNNLGKIIERTSGNRVGTVDINGKKLSGREVRDKLELKSSDFTWKLKGNNIVIETKGFGHGVGMSQYGANFMAEEGKKYDDIVAHYYKGVKIASAEPFLTKHMAKN
ncbi:stage II sporulation protein D [Metabacillus arenae]|uniref:Stage II sporulation protein D n=1 Tax=Metabacillus arenae TaxID=2771434 RepID=A0A926NSQ8_9BACI|nr:stage II sporulation protein D [Metabacillus arenae]MBD1383226.1 stage II sporulation protein D [Metabacillus arenae]